MTKLLAFIASTLANNAAVRAAVGDRLYAFTTEQGDHTYPLIWWQIITTQAMALELCGVGQAWQSEVQVDVFARSVDAAASLAETVRDAFNNAQKTAGILSSYSNQIVPAYADEDETIHYAVRVVVNHI